MKQFIHDQYRETKYDLNERVSKGSDLGPIRYTKSYLMVFFTLIPTIIGLHLVASMVNMRNPIVGVLFCVLMYYTFKRLVAFYESH